MASAYERVADELEAARDVSVESAREWNDYILDLHRQCDDAFDALEEVLNALRYEAAAYSSAESRQADGVCETWDRGLGRRCQEFESVAFVVALEHPRLDAARERGERARLAFQAPENKGDWIRWNEGS